MLTNKESFRLLYQSINELSVELGSNQLDTKSISLLFLEFNFEYEVFEKVHIAIIKYIAHRQVEEIKYKDLCSIIDDNIPDDRFVTEYIK
ncbi:MULTISPECIES: hypothetical protein [Staphylococcus]|uniref:Uncharacterized protein n=1 Tax=Staphylococcus hsinchuensis TaxID=3051183 RepID=A0ABZ3EEY3_9STAP|nr:hypothetical protein [Staphylococcus sp. Marseille-Q6910]